MGSIHPTVSEICVPQSLDPICAKFDKFLAHGQAHMGQMGKWPWQCTTTGLDNSTELRMEKIHQEVTEIWVPQVWQPPARPPARPPTHPPARPPGPWRQYPSSPEGWGVKTYGHGSVYNNRSVYLLKSQVCINLFNWTYFLPGHTGHHKCSSELSNSTTKVDILLILTPWDSCS